MAATLSNDPVDPHSIAGSGSGFAAGQPTTTRLMPLEGAADEASVSHYMASTIAFESTAQAPHEPIQLPGRLQDRYEFRSLLGAGGFGAVYEAWDELLRRAVAIKVARRDRFQGTRGRERFLEEARAAARLKHPDIVAVYDSGADDSGNPFVVFEFVAGESLSERMKRDSLPLETVIALIISVADAIHVAHKQGLIHRDLKPQNILLDAAGHPHVTDFGLAVDEQSQRDIAGQIAGSPQYMSPEQMRGEAQYLDGRTDIWGLGVIMYELLVHRRPFSGRNREELRDEILHREPRPLRAIDDNVPPELERICLKCLSKEVSHRYTTAADVAHDVRRWSRSRTKSPRRIPAVVLWGAVALSVSIPVSVLTVQWLTGQWLTGPRAAATSGTVTTDDGQPQHGSRPASATTGGETSGGETSAAAADPLGWRTRLGADPVELLWPAYRGTSAIGFRNELQAYEINSDAVRLVQLGKLAEPATKVAISFRQPLWHGGAGLFFGYREGHYEGRLCARFQLFSLVKTFNQDGRQVYRLQRGRVIIYPQTGGLLTENEWGFHDVSLPGEGQAGRLVVEFREGRVVAAGWMSENLAELATPLFNEQSTVDDYVGSWGLFQQYGTTWFQHPDLQLGGKSTP